MLPAAHWQTRSSNSSMTRRSRAPSTGMASSIGLLRGQDYPQRSTGSVRSDASGRSLADAIEQQLDDEAESGAIDWDGIIHRIATWPGLPAALDWLSQIGCFRPLTGRRDRATAR